MIYVASSWRNPWQPSVVALLREAGHEVYDFRQPIEGDNGFHWSEVDGGWRTWSPEQYREHLSHPIAERGFQLDMEALSSCEACVLVQPCGTSSHLELGWAAGAKRHTAVLFPLDVQAPTGRAGLDAHGHTLSPHGGPCSGCGDMDGCHVRGRLRRIEPELMAKMADEILLSVDELRAWAAVAAGAR